jgi:hypothetical protein
MLRMWDRQLLELTNNRAVAITFTPVKPTELNREPLPQPSGVYILENGRRRQGFLYRGQ